MRFNKRGQVTLFVIIAIVIAVGVGAFYMFKGKSDLVDSTVPVEVQPLKNYVDSCVEKEIVESIYIVGEGGGYYFPPKEASDVGGLTYYYYQGKNFFPSKSDIEERLSDSIEANILSCVGEFENFQPLSIREGRIKVGVEMLDEIILFNIEYPLEIKLEEEKIILKDFGVYEMPVRMGLIHSSVEDLIDSGYYNEENVCIECFLDVLYEYNFEMDLLDGGEFGSVMIIYDNYNKTVEEMGKQFKYVFALE